MTETNWDPEVLRRAGLEPRHVARVVGIHPVTASNWLCGNKRPHRLMSAEATRLMRAASTALADQALPIERSETMPPDEWSVRTFATLRRYYRAEEESEGAAAG